MLIFTPCLESDDNYHCSCWYELGDACCYCGAYDDPETAPYEDPEDPPFDEGGEG